MTGRTVPGDLGPEGQKALLDELAEVVTSAAPQDWARLAVEYKCLGRHVELGVGVHDATEQPVSWEPPAEVDALFWRLRVGMYEEGRGTWFSAFFRTRTTGPHEIFYNWDNEPPWQPPAESFAHEQRLFPRDGAHQPAWFRRRLEQT